jgi:hypothetical protein
VDVQEGEKFEDNLEKENIMQPFYTRVYITRVELEWRHDEYQINLDRGG